MSNQAFSEIEQKLPLGTYKHYKGKQYEVIGLAHHSETLELLVVYRALYTSNDFGENALWVRLVKMFLETVTINGNVLPRFEYISS